MEQIDSYAPSHQIWFGNLCYIDDIRGDLIFQAFTTLTTTPVLDPEHLIKSKDGGLEPVGLSVAIELNIEDTEGVISPAGPESFRTPPILIKPDSSPYTNYELWRSGLCELGQGTPVPPHPMDCRFPIQTPLLNEVLDLM